MCFYELINGTLEARGGGSAGRLWRGAGSRWQLNEHHGDVSLSLSPSLLLTCSLKTRTHNALHHCHQHAELGRRAPDDYHYPDKYICPQLCPLSLTQPSPSISLSPFSPNISICPPLSIALSLCRSIRLSVALALRAVSFKQVHWLTPCHDHWLRRFRSQLCAQSFRLSV